VAKVPCVSVRGAACPAGTLTGTIGAALSVVVVAALDVACESGGLGAGVVLEATGAVRMATATGCADVPAAKLATRGISAGAAADVSAVADSAGKPAVEGVAAFHAAT
jgi:hypothetical protein